MGRRMRGMQRGPIKMKCKWYTRNAGSTHTHTHTHTDPHTNEFVDSQPDRFVLIPHSRIMMTSMSAFPWLC
jgi:hypothetical protein